jgi:hypothetical protein
MKIALAFLIAFAMFLQVIITKVEMKRKLNLCVGVFLCDLKEIPWHHWHMGLVQKSQKKSTRLKMIEKYKKIVK